jgi:hypothetical protein
MRKLVFIGFVAVAGVVGYILYKRSQQPGLSNLGRWR